MEYSGSPSYGGICLRPVDKPFDLPAFFADEKVQGGKAALDKGF